MPIWLIILIMLFCLLTLGFVGFLTYELWYKRRNLPPGPTPIPLLGNASTFWPMDRWEDKFLEWKRQFGTIYTYWLGTEPVIAINDYELLNQMFVHDGDSYADRMTTAPLDLKSRNGTYGIIETSGAEWREQRQFALKVLHSFAADKSQIQQWILNEIKTLTQNLNQQIESRPTEQLSVQQHTDIAVASVINMLICGYSFTTPESNSREYQEISATVDELTKELANPLANLGAINSLYSKIPPFKGPFDNLCRQFSKVGQFLGKRIEYQAMHNFDEKPTNFIDAYLTELKRHQRENDITHWFSNHQLQNVALDMWLAGKETISYTITWTIGYLIQNPKAQQELHKELDRVVVDHREITLDDSPSLPYTNAVIMESQRMANIISQNLIRRTTRNLNINGYSIKKGTAILAQISAVMADPEVFPNPKQFNPQRFIDSNTGKLKQRDEWMPYSIGRRTCLGEQLARIELFLFISNLFKQYEFTPGNTSPSQLKLSSAVPKAPQSYRCRVKRRFDRL